MTTPDPTELRRRIEEVYTTLTRQKSSHGAITWFSEQANVQQASVSRWVTGERNPSGPVVALLECLEREAGIR